MRPRDTIRALVHRRPDSVKLSGSQRAQAQGAATRHTGSMSRRGNAANGCGADATIDAIWTAVP